MYNDNNIIFAIIANLRQNVLFDLDFAPVGPISVKKNIPNAVTSMACGKLQN